MVKFLNLTLSKGKLHKLKINNYLNCYFRNPIDKIQNLSLTFVGVKLLWQTNVLPEDDDDDDDVGVHEVK